MSVPKEYRYTKDHEWVLITGTTAKVGITEFAQSELGELVFVDLPPSGKKVAPGGVLCVVESTKAASDVYAPIAGTVSEVNADLSSNPTLINQAPYTSGWIAVIEGVDPNSLSGLMSAEDYQALLDSKK
jgi:glycine cleavage system H protein